MAVGNAWSRAKKAAHDVRVLQANTPLAQKASGDQMVYVVEDDYLEIGQGGVSPMRGWGALGFIGLFLAAGYGLWGGAEMLFDTWQRFGFGGHDGLSIGSLIDVTFMLLAFLMALGICGIYLKVSFFSVTDATIRFDAKRRKVWMWTEKGPIEMDWENLSPRIESSVVTAYATVKTYRGQYAELDQVGMTKTTNGIPHVFQCGQISSSESGVLPSMEYIRLYMSGGLSAVPKPERLLSHRPRWYAMVNFFGLADDWVRWRELRNHSERVSPPWIRSLIFVVFFPILFPLQFTNWLALIVAPVPKWPSHI